MVIIVDDFVSISKSHAKSPFMGAAYSLLVPPISENISYVYPLINLFVKVK